MTTTSCMLDLPVSDEFIVLHPPGHGPAAFDVVPLSAGRLSAGTYARLVLHVARADQLHGWDSEVLAPCDGRIAVAHDGEPDRMRVAPVADLIRGFITMPLRWRNDIARMAGNHVVIESDGFSVFLAHLRKGSVRPSVGTAVGTGDVLGSIGRSGNSVAPHLHIQVNDSADLADVSRCPFSVRAFDERSGEGWETRTNQPFPRRPRRLRPPSR